jgi:drug/metabolite transporter (DMT)-like permease
MSQKSIIYMIISALAFTFLNVFVKLLDRFDVPQIIFFRSFGSLIFTSAFLIRQKISPLGNKKTLLVLRALAGLLSMGLFFAALKYLQMGSAVSLRYISPIFAMLFALIFLKEKVKRIQWVFILIAFSGVLLMKGFNDAMSTIGLLLILGSALLSGLVFILIRKIGDSDHPVVVVHYFMLISAIVSGIFSITYWKSPIGIEWLFLICLGLFGYLGQLYMTKAFQSGQMNLLAPLKYLEVLFTMALGLIWLNETYSLWSLIGILLVLLGLTLNTLTKKRT